MTSPAFRVALAQVNPTVGDLAGNITLMCEYIERARALGADLVAFPEMCLTGYPPEDLILRPHFVEDAEFALNDLAACGMGVPIVAGCLYSSRGKIHNAAAIVHRNRVAGVYFKQRLPNYGVFDERRYFDHGTRNLIWQLGDAVFGVTVCEDIWHENGPHAAQARAGAGVLVNISASPYHARKHSSRQEMLTRRAIRNRSYICYVNLVGGQDELIFDGGSMIIAPDGTHLATGRLFEEDLVVADLDLQQLIPSRCKPRPAGGVKLRKLKPYNQTVQRPELTGHFAPGFSQWEEVYRALVLGLRDYVAKNGFSKVVIGLSGGVDSALTAAIAVDSLGSENVIGVTMPSQYTSSGTRTDAGTLAGNLGIRFITLPIGDIFEVYLRELADVFEGCERDVTEENLQARIRANLLMALSNKFGWLVVTTGNKSETSVGYTTLFGDMAGGFSLLKDVPKTWVYELCKLRNTRAGYDHIPQSVIDRPPSAELRPDQKDQDSLPPYDLLDAILDAYIEKDKSRAQIAQMGFEPGIVNKVTVMVDKNEYKRRQAPPGLKITPKAFGRDRRMPITNRYT